MVSKNPGVSIQQVIEKIHSLFNYNVSYKKAWHEKHKAMSIMFRN